MGNTFIRFVHAEGGRVFVQPRYVACVTEACDVSGSVIGGLSEIGMAGGHGDTASLRVKGDPDFVITQLVARENVVFSAVPDVEGD